MKFAQSKASSFLSRLRRNETGNVLVIVAAAMVPLAGMTGAAIDFSRTYLVKARMQQACDAGALAGRRSMSGTVLTTADQQVALNYFNFNFPTNLMGSASMSTTDATAANHVSSKLVDGQLQMEATTSVPTTLLRVIGMSELRASVTCLAEEYYVNTDLMLVLDTTGSMNCYMSDGINCSQETEKSTTGSGSSIKRPKMLEMRNALKTLYSNLRPAQTALEDKNLRMRIGFLQFSSTVNVGKLLLDEESIQSKTFVRRSYQYRNSSGALKATTDWPTYSSTWISNTWEGCIEERSTSTALTASSTTIPSDAWDLDIAKISDSDTTRWAPYDYATLKGSTRMSEESMGSYTGSYYYRAACPKPAVHMKAWASQSEFDTQVDKIVQGDGATYHDIGITWGLRMIANDGMFGYRNPDKFNNVKVRRTIVFMTDGFMQPLRDAYSAYGVAQYAGRTASASTQNTGLEPIHTQRFKLMCAKAKASPYNVDIWVIAVLSGQAMDADIASCASNSSQSILVSNSTDLANAFKRISDKVGNLRLGQ